MELSLLLRLLQHGMIIVHGASIVLYLKHGMTISWPVGDHSYNYYFSYRFN